MNALIQWAIAHPEQLPVAFAATATLARVLYALLSRLVRPYPRVRALVEALAAASPDVVRAGQQLASAVLGRPVASLDRRAPDDDRAALLRRAEDAEREVARLRDAVAALRAPATLEAVRAGRVVDDDLSHHRTTIPGGQSGRASVAVLALVAAVSVAALAGCPRLPERSGCAEGTRACVEGAPHVCDGDGRYHRAGDLACAAVGGVCVSSEGRAWCAPAVDGGAVTDAGDAE